MFPVPTELRSNISFHEQNLLEKFPAEYLGKYDVVNVRLMVAALSSAEWGPAVKNIMTLLRRGARHTLWHNQGLLADC